MTDLQLFDDGEFQLRIIATSDSFKVEAPGLARALGFREAYDLIQSIPDEEKGSGLTRTPGGDQQVWHVTEPGFYRAIGQRQSARVKDPAIREKVTRFQNWVYRDVLPAIRRTGSYSAAPPPAELSRKELARYWYEAEERAEVAERRNAELEAPAEAWNTLASASGDYSVRQAAQILNRDPEISTGQNRLFAKLRELQWIDRNGIPYQEQVDAGRIVQRPTSYTHPHHGESVLTSQVRVTVRGVQILRKLLGGDDGQLFAIPGGA